MGRNRTSREMYIYFKDCSLAESRKLTDVVERHCVSLEFVAELKEPDAVKFQEKSPNYIRGIGGIWIPNASKNNLGMWAFMIVRRWFCTVSDSRIESER